MTSDPRASPHSSALYSIDDTISRSRQVVQDSIELTRRNTERKQQLEQRMQAFMQKHQEFSRPQSASDAVGTPVDSRVKELETRLKHEEYLKQGFERTVWELKERVKELEGGSEAVERYREEIEELRGELLKEREWRDRFADIEKALNQRLSEQEARITFLETQLRAKDSELQLASSRALEQERLSKDNQQLTATLQQLQMQYESLTQECRDLASPKDEEYLSTLHKELTLQRRANEEESKAGRQIAELERKMRELEDKYASQMEYSRELQTQLRQAYEPEDGKSRAKRIEELEEKLKASSGKYEQMKRQITAPSSFHKTRDSPRGKSKHSDDAQSFRAYSIREDPGLPPRKPNKRSRSVEKRGKVYMKPVPHKN